MKTKILCILLIVVANITLLAENPEWLIYNKNNSVIQSKRIYDLEFDKKRDGIWIASFGNDTGPYIYDRGGLINWDLTNWIYYNTSNSGLPRDLPEKLEIDNNNTIWIGVLSNGLVSFDGNSWIIYDTSNSKIAGNSLFDIAIDSCNIKWLSTADENGGG